MDSNVFLVLIVTIAAAILFCGPQNVSAQTIGSVQFINGDVTEGVTIKLCTGPDGGHVGPGWIAFPGYQYYQFQVNALSRGWSCDFEYKSAAGGAIHTANVLVWQSLLSYSAMADDNVEMAIAVVPCINCIWKVLRDGFYRTDDNDHANFRLMARWNN